MSNLDLTELQPYKYYRSPCCFNNHKLIYFRPEPYDTNTVLEQSDV